MTDNNEKQYVEGKIQDFDEVSLYPSAMRIMPDIPKGKPQIIPPNTTHDQLMCYDTFFIEINIKRLTPKSMYSYMFCQVFKRNEEGVKLFGNQTVDHFYIDKIGLIDLCEAYDIEYELLHGYYFNDGFNSLINKWLHNSFFIIIIWIVLREQFKYHFYSKIE